MALAHGRQTVFKLDDLAGSLQDVSAFFKSADGMLGNTDRPPTTTFGQVAERRQVMGLRDAGPISLAGPYQAVSGTKIHGKSTRVLVDQYPLWSDLKEATLQRTVDLPETMTFGDSWKERGVVGKQDGSLSASGFFNSGAGNVDAVMRTLLGQEAAAIISIGAAGFAIGSLVDMFQAVLESYEVPNDEESVVEVSTEFKTEERIDLGVSLHDVTNESSAGNYASVDETAATSDGGVAHLHVTVFTSGSGTVKVQHSTDNSVWVDLITFSAVTAVGKQRSEVSGSISRYVRATSAGTFNFTFQVSFARRGFAYGTAGTYRHFCGLYAKTATSSFEYGPEGGTSGKVKLSGECRLSSLELALSEEAVTDFTVELTVDGAVAEGTF